MKKKFFKILELLIESEVLVEHEKGELAVEEYVYKGKLNEWLEVEDGMEERDIREFEDSRDNKEISVNQFEVIKEEEWVLKMV